MASNKVTYNVGTSNQFSAFYEDADSEKYVEKGLTLKDKPLQVQKGPHPGFQYAVQYSLPPEFHRTRDDKVPSYTEDNILDTRAKEKKQGRRFKGNPNGPRKFDRMSGTGRGREIKKQGEGGHNWGGVSKDANLENTEEQKELTNELNNLNLNEKLGEESKEKNKSQEKEKEQKNDIMDLESYKELQKSRRKNLPTFTDNEKKTIQTDEELQNDGYVKYLKQSQENKPQEKPKVTPAVTSQTANTLFNFLPKPASSYSARRLNKKYPSGTKTKQNNPRVRVKAPDLTDLKVFPSLCMKS